MFEYVPIGKGEVDSEFVAPSNSADPPNDQFAKTKLDPSGPVSSTL